MWPCKCQALPFTCIMLSIDANCGNFKNENFVNNQFRDVERRVSRGFWKPLKFWDTLLKPEI